MTKKYIRLIYLALLAALLFPVTILWLANSYSTNVLNGLTMILILAILVGLLSARYTLSWLIIILTTIAAAFVLLGYVVMPSDEKIMLIITFPVEASLLNVIRHHILRWKIIAARERDVHDHISHCDLNVKLQTQYNAEKFYERELYQIRHYAQLKLWANIELIRWEHHKQVEDYHPQSHARILRHIAAALKKTRLETEFIYYLDDGTFMIISPQIDSEIVKKINQKTNNALKRMDIDIPIELKAAVQRVDLQNMEQFSDFEKLTKHLRRGLETDIIVEYLKDDRDD